MNESVDMFVVKLQLQAFVMKIGLTGKVNAFQIINDSDMYPVR